LHNDSRAKRLEGADTGQTMSVRSGPYSPEGGALKAKATMMRSVFVLILLGITPALAQGVTNNRDANGNLPRDKGVSTSDMQRRALVSGAVDQSGLSPPTGRLGLKAKVR
jgi:hypothetical protein